MSVERAINQGLRAGRVVEPRYEGALVAFDCEVAAGDMLEIRSTPGPDAPADVPKRWPIVPCPRDVASGEEVLIPCKRKVEASSAVHVVRSASTILEAEAAVREMREEEVRLAAAESGGVAPEACLEASEVVAGRGGVAASELGVDCASADLLALPCSPSPRKWGVGEPGAGGACTVEQSTGGACKSPHTAVDLGEVCRLEDLEGVRAACERVVRGEAPAVVVRNIGQIPTVRAAGVPWEVGSPLQVWNAETARVLVRLGARRVWLPEELTMEDLASVRAQMEDPASGTLRGRPAGEPASLGCIVPGGGCLICGVTESPHAVEHHPGDIVDIAADGSTPLMITHCRLLPRPMLEQLSPARAARESGGRSLPRQLDRKARERALPCVDEGQDAPVSHDDGAACDGVGVA
ncbi:MAG: hypothetical protein ACLTKG_00870 [Collinsella intestinalis]